MDFIKKHYEKVLLGIVLIGLVIAIGFLPIKIKSEKQKLEDLANSLTHPKVKPLTNLDLTASEAMLKRMAVPAVVDFSGTNKLFNPMTWQQGKDNHLIRLDKAGPVAAVVTNITPLYLIISAGSISTDSEGTPRYTIVTERQTASTTAKRRPASVVLKNKEKNDMFVLSAVNTVGEQTNLTLVLNDTGETVTLSKEKPYKRIDGYMASLKYDPEKKAWRDRRVGDALIFNGEDYNIVAITPTEVVLSAKSNQKKWTIKFNPAPS